MHSMISRSNWWGCRFTWALVVVVTYCGTSAAQNGTWTDADGDGLWSDSLNWSGGTIADGSGNTADFSQADVDGNTVNTNFPGFYRNGINLDTARTIGNLIFGDSNTGTPGGWEIYTLNASALTLAGTSPTITVSPLGPYVAPTETIDDAAIRTVLAGNSGFTKTGTGILTIGGATPATNTITGAINLNQGTLRLVGPGALNLVLPVSARVNIASGTTLALNTNIRPTGVADQPLFTVADGGTANFVGIGSSEIGRVNAPNATLNFNVQAGTFTLAGNMLQNLDPVPAAVAGPSVVNITGAGTATEFRLLPNPGNSGAQQTQRSWNSASFGNAAVNLDNIVVWTRTNGGGNLVQFGSLTGTSTAVLSGGGQGGGTVATYQIGALNTDTTFAGTIDITSAPDVDGGLNILKVGTGKLTLSGTLSYQPTVNGTVNRRGGVTTVSTGTLALTNNAAIPGGVSVTNPDMTVTTQNSVVNVLGTGTLDVTGSTIPGGYSTALRQTVVGTGQIVGNWLHDEGIIAPGDTVTGATGTNPNPNPVAAAGTLTFGNTLSFGSSGTLLFDLTPNPAGTNDLLQVNSVNLSSGTPTVSLNFLGGTPSGTYTLINSTTPLVGNTSGWNVQWGGRGTPPALTQTTNQVQITVSAADFGDVTWHGQTNGTWDVNSTTNWVNLDNNLADKYFQGDSVLFADSNPLGTPSNTTAITLSTTVTPSAVTFNNSALNYSITGSGKISGSTGLTKQGSGTLTMTTPNDYLGPTSIQGGTVNIGTQLAALGAGPTSIITMSGNSTLIANSAGNGAGLTNAGLVMAAGSTNTISNDGTTGQSTQFPGLSGSGNLNLVTLTAGRLISLVGNNAAFSGNLNVGMDGIAITLRTQGGGTSLTNANVTLGPGSSLRDFSTSVQTISIGALNGDNTTFLGGQQGGSGAQAKTWEIGNANSSTDFAGTIIDGDSGGQTAVTHITKVGTGTLTLSGANQASGTMTVNGGTLRVNGTHVPNMVTIGAAPNYVVNSGGTLGGTGTIGDGVTPVPITVNAGGSLAPGASIGTLTARGNVTFADDSIFRVEVDAMANTSDLLAVTGDLALGGADLAVSLLAGSLPTGPHVIATYSGLLTGAFTVPAGILVDYGTGSNSQITMTVNALGLPGDHNQDGLVDAADYVLWRKDPGNHGGDPGGYTAWRTNFGSSSPGGGGDSGSVPEPATATLVAMMLGLVWASRRRQ
jgi:autotransporter-associated beta strand protein